ncbi:MAG: hypothetical protein V3W19_12230 [Desulfatiglandales bacterium]
MMLGFSEELQAHRVSKGAISPESLKKRSDEIKILDVGSEKEYEKELIDKAVVIPLKELSGRYREPWVSANIPSSDATHGLDDKWPNFPNGRSSK